MTDDESTTSERIRNELRALDEAVYVAVAGAQTPTLDLCLRTLSRAADKSVLWIGVAGAMTVLGGPRARRAALSGLASIGIASSTVNIVAKQAFHRRRPDREAFGVPFARHVVMPMSTSFPSGHAASAFAFAEGVAVSEPALGAMLRALAAAVAYSRVHTGVHYPGDVIAGLLIGMTAGRVGALAVTRIIPDRH